MKKIAVLFVLLLSVTLLSCKSKYPELSNGLYAEFVTNKGTFVAKLYAEETPLTVANFVELAKGTHPMVDSIYKGKPYYNGLTFHRVMKDFMIQGGDPKADGTGSPGYKFPDEFNDTLVHSRKGILSMANPGPDANGSQFFITLKETPWLNGRHTVFGEIVIGQEVVDSIALVEVAGTPPTKPVEDVVMQEVNIINKGANLPSFSTEMERIEQIKKEKEERLAAVATESIGELNKFKDGAEELDSGLKIYWNHRSKAMKPAEGSVIKMNYAGYFADGKLLDTNILEVAEKYEAVDPQKVAQGMYAPTESQYSKDARLIPGFKEGLLSMSLGDKVTLFIPSHLAYGEQGYGTIIPPNSDLVFQLELTEVVQPKK